MKRKTHLKDIPVLRANSLGNLLRKRQDIHHLVVREVRERSGVVCVITSVYFFSIRRGK